MVAQADFKPDEVMVDVIDAALASVTKGVNLLAGPRTAYDLKSLGIPHEAVFVEASGGVRSRAIKGGPDERAPQCVVRIRSKGPGSPTAFATGQQLARDVLNAVDQNPPADWCEFRAFDSHPSYEGKDDDGHHEWSFVVEVIVDVA